MPKHSHANSNTPEPGKQVPQISIIPALHPNIPVESNVTRVPLAVKRNHAPLSPRTKNIQKPSLETTCLSSSAPKRAPLKRTPSIRLGEGIGGKATVVFEETVVPPAKPVMIGARVTTKKRKPAAKSGRTKRVRRDDPGKENIPPVNLGVRRSTREPRSADLEEIAMGLVALRDGR
jgi:hypothetical protein